jgi:hypothetical protein
MNKCIILSVAAILSVGACTSRKQAGEQGSVPEPVSTSADYPVEITPVENYFVTAKPDKVLGLLLDSISFYNYFHPATTMKNRPATIDFSSKQVAAIILPETNKETGIRIETALVRNNVLHVSYSVQRGSEPRTFTVVPANVFTFKAPAPVYSAEFVAVAE